MAKRQSIAFMSYVRVDDQHENGRLTQFRERLGAEVRMQTGEDFPIFQDRNDILWGQNWQERIETSLDEVTFLIPIITPSFFKSPACRDELERFFEREKKLNRSDLILPVYYVETALMHDEAKRANDKLAQAIAARQYADWRELRFDPFTNPQVGKMMARLAVQIREALERDQPIKKAGVTGEMINKATSTAAELPLETPQVTESKSTLGQFASQASAKNVPPTLVVDQLHRGNHVTITEAINAAKPGDRILVRPGFYQEGLIIDKPLEIVGDGGPGEVVIQAEGKDVILFKATMGRVANLTLRQMGGGEWFGVDITQGRLELEDCDIISQSLACIVIRGGADPRVRRNRIHDGKQSGIFVCENGQGTLEDNDIFGNTLFGVSIKEGGNPTLRRNRVHDGKGGGVRITLNGQGTLEDNDIFGNTHTGVAIKEGGNPTLRRNRIHDNKEVGVFVYENGQGVLDDNDIFGNTKAGVLIQEGSNPTLRHNRINKNGYKAVWIKDGGAGTIEDNDLRDNGSGAWDISKDSEPKVKRARNLE